MLTRRDFLKSVSATALVGALPAGCRSPGVAAPASRIRFGYAAITWGGADRQAIDDISALGYPGIQLRSGAVAQFGADPAALGALLERRRLSFVALSSGNLSIDPAREAAMLAEHTAHARFLRDAGGLNLQLIDERPAGRDVTVDDCARLGGLLTEIGRRAADVGVQVVYHPHMGTIGERPENAERVLAASDPAVVKLLLDVAHYTQGGGDPAAAIRRHHARIGLLHIKDVEPIPAAPGYRFTELGRGRVDLPAVFDALRDVRYDGWAVVELDDVVGPGGTPAQAAANNKRYLESRGFQL
ncbi:MAG TPA: TIM barrel protein [Gemmatimonadaceae bacterium]|nr:TIM barrel protein [Gemmatimonadaceae bacterium]